MTYCTKKTILISQNQQGKFATWLAQVSVLISWGTCIMLFTTNCVSMQRVHKLFNCITQFSQSFTLIYAKMVTKRKKVVVSIKEKLQAIKRLERRDDRRLLTAMASGR